ncbi:hypothetical protein GCM10023321_52610 [Pseudonocardia eucalypti]|uniref:DUF3040 domain-containing protein n=1 Tax=Pseudonocardia eucalypti TaxID=648755 RepID=A0ABP9QMB3_9PSEU|nr:hypothetical protein [Pseudonocardia eucalypti]
MTAALPPDPRKPAPLTDRERQLFAKIADEVRVDDADIMAQEGWIPIRLAFPVPLKPAALRALLVAGLLLGGLLLPPAWWSVLGMIFALFVVPCLVLGALWQEDD